MNIISNDLDWLSSLGSHIHRTDRASLAATRIPTLTRLRITAENNNDAIVTISRNLRIPPASGVAFIHGFPKIAKGNTKDIGKISDALKTDPHRANERISASVAPHLRRVSSCLASPFANETFRHPRLASRSTTPINRPDTVLALQLRRIFLMLPA
jgi:hypothetical protein